MRGRQRGVRKLRFSRRSGKRSTGGINVAECRRSTVRVDRRRGADRVQSLLIVIIHLVKVNRATYAVLIHVINYQAVSRKHTVEFLRLAVFEHKIVAVERCAHDICGRLVAGGRNVLYPASVGQRFRCHPSELYFLPHIDMRRRVARSVILVPDALRHTVPHAGSVETAVYLIIHIIIIRSAEIMPELVAKHADSGHLSGQQKLRLNGVFLHIDTIKLHIEHLRAVRPYIGRQACDFRALSLMNNRQTVEHTVAIVVEIPQIHLIVDKRKRVTDKVSHILRIVHRLLTRQCYPPYNGSFHVQLSIRIFKIKIPETACPLVILAVHKLNESFRLNRCARVSKVDEQHQQPAMPFERESAVGLQHPRLRSILLNAGLHCRPTQLMARRYSRVIAGIYHPAVNSGIHQVSRFSLFKNITAGRFYPVAVLIAAHSVFHHPAVGLCVKNAFRVRRHRICRKRTQKTYC